MELRHLRYFLLVGKLQNIHKAATRLGITQPALSRQIRDLEIELGAPLLIRQPRGVSLTTAGQAFLQEAEQILASVQSATNRFRAVSAGKSATLCLAYNGIAAHQPSITSLFTSFRGEYRDVELKVMYMLSQTQVAALEAGEIDAGFGCWATPSSDRGLAESLLAHRTVGEDDYALALPVGHHLAQRQDLRMADLEGEPFIFMSRSCSPDLYDRLMAACRLASFSPHVVHEVDHEISLLDFIAAGMGLCFLNASLRCQRRDQVVLKTLPDFSVPVHLDLVWRKDHMTAALSRFLGNIPKELLFNTARRTPGIH